MAGDPRLPSVDRDGLEARLASVRASIAEARAHGKARIEGKDYVMQDGDVVEFRFNN